MDYKNVLATSIISGVISIFLLFTINPILSSEISPYLHILELTDANLILGYIGILILFASMNVFFIIFARTKFSELFSSLLYCVLFSIIILSLASWLILAIINPNLFYGLNSFSMFLHLFLYPSVVCIVFNRFELFWIISMILTIVLFNIQYLYNIKHPIGSQIEKPKNVEKYEKIEQQKKKSYQSILGIEIVVIIGSFIGIYYVSKDYFYNVLIDLIMVMGFTAILHFALRSLVKNMRKDQDQETILEHAIFSTLAILITQIIDYYFIDGSVDLFQLFNETSNWIYIGYLILQIFFVVGIFYFISAISYLILKEHRTAIDIISLAVAYPLGFVFISLNLLFVFLLITLIFSAIIVYISVLQGIY